MVRRSRTAPSRSGFDDRRGGTVGRSSPRGEWRAGREMEMFRESGGALFELMKAIGRPMNDCGGTSPLALMLSARVLNDRWIVAHRNELTPDDLKLLAAAPKFHIAHCPRSHRYFGHSRFRFEELRALGFNIVSEQQPREQRRPQLVRRDAPTGASRADTFSA